MSPATTFERRANKAFPFQPHVVAVHGSASTSRQWRGLADRLSPAFNVATPDLPGYGRQQGGIENNSPSLTGDAVEIAGIAQSASAPIHIVAHSYGAAVALRFAIDNPQHVASLTLIEPALFHLLRSGKTLDMAHYTEISRISNAVRIADWIGAPAYGMSRFVDYWNSSGTWRAMKPSLQTALAGQAGQVARNFAAAFAETWGPGCCRQIQCPTRFIVGKDSRGPAKRVSQILFEAIPQACLKTIDGAGHMAPVTHPHIINPLIAEALAAATLGGNEVSHREAA